MKRVITAAAAGYVRCGAAEADVRLVESFVRACVKRGARAVFFPACAYCAQAGEVAKQFGVSLAFGTFLPGEGYRAAAICHPQGEAVGSGDINALADVAAELFAEYPDGQPVTVLRTVALAGEGADAV